MGLYVLSYVLAVADAATAGYTVGELSGIFSWHFFRKHRLLVAGALAGIAATVVGVVFA
ncbi:MAG TPA: hypothetical protein VGF95_09250 [Solirubrobacteraceae bacterium]|jgi:hypothetical protein